MIFILVVRRYSGTSVVKTSRFPFQKVSRSGWTRVKKKKKHPQGSFSGVSLEGGNLEEISSTKSNPLDHHRRIVSNLSFFTVATSLLSPKNHPKGLKFKEE